MNDTQQTGPGMRVITISREYGSGGGEIAARLARRLGWRLIDHEIVAQVAYRTGIPISQAQAHDEVGESFIARILNSLQFGAPEGLPVPPPETGITTRIYYQTLQQIMEQLADEGEVVIVGRGGQIILQNRRDALHVRIVAPFTKCVAYVARREGLSEAAARARTLMKNRARARYIQTLYHRNHDDPHLYDLVINTGIIDLEGAVDLICTALTHKARMLTVPEPELGPAAGMTRYPGQPADFPLPPS
jgi:cytidylate kinase